MAEEVEMTPVDMTPVDAAEPPKANPLAKPAVPKPATLKLNPVAKPAAGGGALKPGLKLPPKPAIGAGVKLPTQNALKPGLKLPPKPGATVSALKPGIKLPAKPVIHKPGAAMSAPVLPKPVLPKPITPTASAPAAAPEAAAPSATPAAAAPVAEAKPAAPAAPNPMQQLKSVTQKLKGVTQEIPAQAILRKTGIIADDAMTEAQKAAAKHKTARISLSDAMGVAPVKESAPLKTIRIKRPGDIPGAPAHDKALAPAGSEQGGDAPAAAPHAATAESTVTQRKTLKISRPGGAVRPAGKFGIKRPGVPAPAAVESAPAAAGGDAPAAVADIPDIPSTPKPNVPAEQAADDGPAWAWTLSTLVQAAACVALGALAWFLYQNTQTMYF